MGPMLLEVLGQRVVGIHRSHTSVTWSHTSDR
jgi:hypothetical protein